MTEITSNLHGDDITYQQASEHPGWVASMDDEISSIKKNDTWDLIKLSQGKKTISAC
jgi:hypothetical protein